MLHILLFIIQLFLNVLVTFSGLSYVHNKCAEGQEVLILEQGTA